MLQQAPRPWPSKFKTVLCQYYDGTPSSCRFGVQCRYAHGQHELRAAFPVHAPRTFEAAPVASPPVHHQPQLAPRGLFNTAGVAPPPPPPPPMVAAPTYFTSPFPGFAAPWAQSPSLPGPPRAPFREARQREYRVVKLGEGFKVLHEVKFTNFTAATQFFTRALKGSDQGDAAAGEPLVSTFVAPNLVFVSTGAHGVFLTGLSELAGKKVLRDLGAVVSDDEPRTTVAGAKEEEGAE